MNYLAEICNGLETFFIIVSILFGLFFWLIGMNRRTAANKKDMNEYNTYMCYCFLISIISFLLYVFIPSKEVLLG